MTPILSILIPSIPEREYLLTELLNRLSRQRDNLYEKHPSLGEVEIIVDSRDKFLSGGPSIGEKRGSLLFEATGEYCDFLDDDEGIAPNYLEALVRACHWGKDVVSFRCFVSTDTYWSVVLMSLAHVQDEQLRPGFVLRKPWHICPIKREIAQSEKFNALNHGEDVDWLNRVIPKCKTELYLPDILVHYNHSEQHSEADKIIRHEASNH